MYRKYFIERDDIEKATYASLLEEVESSFDRQLLDHLPYFSFAMLKPDVYLRGLAPEIIRIFHENGVYVAYGNAISLTNELIDRLYMFVKQKYFDTWWVMKKTYTLASCTPLLLVGESKGFEHLSARIRELIGPTTPIVGRPEQVRYRLRATHRVFNLVHGTDDPASAVREALIFFSREQLTRALRMAEPPIDGAAVSANGVPRESLVSGEPRDIRFGKVRLDVKARLAKAAQEVLAAYSFRGKDDLLARLDALLDKERDVVGRNLLLRQERSELSDVFRDEVTLLLLLDDIVSELVVEGVRGGVAERDQACSLKAMERARAFLRVVVVLADDARFRYCDFDGIIGDLASQGEVLAAEEEVVLHTGWAVAKQEIFDLHSKAGSLEGV